MNDRSLPPLSLDPVALAQTAKNFLDAVEVWWYVLPPATFDPEEIARGREPTPRYVPDQRSRDRADIHNLLCAFRHLEAQFNPDHVKHSDLRRITRIADWIAAEEERQFLWTGKPSPGEICGTRWRNARALALAVDTIWDWWRSQGVPGRADDFPGPFHPWQLPRGLVRDMRAAADDLIWAGEDDTGPPRSGAGRATRTSLTPLESHSRARGVVLICSAISRTVHLGAPQMAGTSLLSLLDDLCDAVDHVPALGWEGCIGDTPFEFDGITRASAHQAVLPLAERFHHRCWHAAYEAKFQRWGATSADFFLSTNLLWNDAALHGLRKYFTEPPFGNTAPVPVQRWLTQLDIEAARLRAANAPPALAGPVPTPATSGAASAAVGAPALPAPAATTAPPASKPKVTNGRGKHVEARMLKLLEDDHSRYDWSAEQFAQNLGCSKPTVINTNAWKNIMKARAMRAADRVSATGALAPRRKKR